MVAPKAKSTKSKAAVLNKTPCKIHTVTSCLGLLGSHLVLFIRTDSNKFPLVVCLGWCSMFCHNQQHTLDYRGCFSIKSSISITGFQSNMCTLRVWTNKLRNSEDRGFGTVGKASQVKSLYDIYQPLFSGPCPSKTRHQLVSRRRTAFQAHHQHESGVTGEERQVVSQGHPQRNATFRDHRKMIGG